MHINCGAGGRSSGHPRSDTGCYKGLAGPAFRPGRRRCPSCCSVEAIGRTGRRIVDTVSLSHCRGSSAVLSCPHPSSVCAGPALRSNWDQMQNHPPSIMSPPASPGVTCWVMVIERGSSTDPSLSRPALSCPYVLSLELQKTQPPEGPTITIAMFLPLPFLALIARLLCRDSGL